MDSINLETPDFTITVRRDGRVSATPVPQDDMEFMSEDITDTTLGKILVGHYADVFEGR